MRVTDSSCDSDYTKLRDHLHVMGFRMMDDDEDIQPAVQLEFEQERHDEGDIPAPHCTRG